MENSLPKYITLTEDNIDKEHICCAFSDKKCLEGYESKKEWLKKEFANGYVFRRLDARAKVFIEYVPAEYAWLPVTAPNYLMINCFWVSGQYKGQGHGYNLLQFVIEDAKKQQKNGLVTVVGTKKNHFMSDTKWLLQHGFKEIEKLPNGFSLLVMSFHENSAVPYFNDCVKSGECPDKLGIVAYYSNRCPYTDYYVNGVLRVPPAYQRHQVLLRESSRSGTAVLQGEPCQTGEDAARRVEQGGNKENTRRDGDRPAFLLYVLHTLFRRVAHQRTAGTETRRHQRIPLPDTGAAG